MALPFANIGPVVLSAFGAPSAIGVTRYASGSYVDGRWSSGAGVATSVDAAVHPAGRRDVEKLPEGEQTKEAIAIYTISPLKTSKAGTGQKSDVVAWRDQSYEVQAVEDWTAQAGYALAIATRIGV
jgi:hypothetical protein